VAAHMIRSILNEKAAMRIFERYKLYLYFTAVVAVSLFLGLGSGIFIGKGLMRQSLAQGGHSILLFRPAYDYFMTYGLINSNNEMKRLTGYYTLLESRYYNEDFLIDRYKKENSPVIKRTIVWILGFSGEKEKVITFYNGVYKESSRPIQRQIQEAYSRIDPSGYSDFMRKKNINSGLRNK